MASPITTRSSVGRYFQLLLDGGADPAGFVRSVDFGGIKGELLAQQVGGQAYRVKGIHNPAVDPVTVQVGFSMSDVFYTWIAKSWAGECMRQNGSIIVYDHNLNPIYEYQFSEALILETTVPALDASSKDAAFMTIKFQPETAEHALFPSLSYTQPKTPVVQKMWLPCNFRFEIDGIDVKRVTKIESFTVKQNVKPMTCGPQWMYQIEPTSLEYPNITATFSIANAGDWFDWHKDFVVDGNNGPDKEKTGAITMLAQDLQQELLTVNLKQVGICNLALEKSDAGGNDTIARVKVDLYCEEMELEWQSAGLGSGSTGSSTPSSPESSA
jgi:phage tail-like protein